jgi:membrane protein
MERSSTEAEKRERGDGSPTEPVRRDYAPAGTYAKPTLFGVLRRTATEFSEDNLTDWAAALTYYGLLSLFPALIAVVSIIGLVGDPDSTTNTLRDIVDRIGPNSAANTFDEPIRQLTESRATAGFALLVSTLVALWSASGYLGAFTRASNVIYETREGRPFWKLRPLQVLLTLAIVVLLALMTVGIVITGPIASAVGGHFGISGTVVTVWDVAKWVVIAGLFLLMLGLIYYASPNVRQRGFSWITRGGLVALVGWLIASAAFGLYASQFGSYNKTYGSMAGVVIVLIWMWITNLAILFGHELNAEREREIEFKEGMPGADREIQLEPREAPKRPRTV